MSVHFDQIIKPQSPDHGFAFPVVRVTRDEPFAQEPCALWGDE